MNMLCAYSSDDESDEEQQPTVSNPIKEAKAKLPLPSALEVLKKPTTTSIYTTKSGRI